MATDPQHDSLHDSQVLAAHTPEAIRRRLTRGSSYSYLRDFVYGAIDGAVTTFAVVCGVTGAGLSSEVILILGAANLIGDGFSMAAGNYLGTRAERQQRDRLRKMEERHIDLTPAGEREEIRQILAAQGFQGDDLQRAVDVVTSDRQRWIDMMLKEEHGLAAAPAVPLRAATATFVAFLAVGALPLLPFLLALASPAAGDTAFTASTVMTAAAFFMVGAIKSRFVDEHWLWAGVTTLGVGALAAGLAYLVGAFVAALTTSAAVT